jgi:hypothetical protein
MRRLWLRMTEIYGHRWTSAYGVDQEAGAGKTWAQGLAGLTTMQIGLGIERALLSAEEWPPTLPKFRALCFGIPPLAAVKLDLKSDHKAPFTRMVWSKIDSYRYRNATAEAADFLLKDAYEIAREAVMSGTPLPEDAAGTIDAPKEPKPVPASPETAMKHIEEIQKLLGGGNDVTETA